jgi:hypothetical protein
VLFSPIFSIDAYHIFYSTSFNKLSVLKTNSTSVLLTFFFQLEVAQSGKSRWFYPLWVMLSGGDENNGSASGMTIGDIHI